jgi:signal transduction histidine kinase
VGQPLAGIQLNLEILDAFADGLPKPAAEALRRLHRLAEEALGQARALAHSLHPPAWQQLPIGVAIRQLLDASGVSSRMETVLNIDAALAESSLAPSHAGRIALYRCAQECLSNVLRHSEATRLEITLRIVNVSVELTVCDNGKGFANSFGGGIGLAAIEEHARALDGEASFSGLEKGTTVVVSIPVNAE